MSRGGFRDRRGYGTGGGLHTVVPQAVRRAYAVRELLPSLTTGTGRVSTVHGGPPVPMWGPIARVPRSPL